MQNRGPMCSRREKVVSVRVSGLVLVPVICRYRWASARTRSTGRKYIYLYSCTNFPLLQEERMGYAEGRNGGRRAVYTCAYNLWMSLCDTEPRLDMKDGETVKYTAQYFAGARFVAVSPKLTRNSNCYMRHRTPRIYVDTRWREKKNYPGVGITVHVCVAVVCVFGSNVVTRKCCVDVNPTVTLS